MESKTFDRETILDLMVNFIPLGIILFFIGLFAVFAPWGVDLLPTAQMFAIMGLTFLALLVLTYLSAKAIAGDEKRATVYAQGQAGLEGAEPLHEHEDDTTATAASADSESADSGSSTVEEEPATDAESVDAESADAESVDESKTTE